MKKNADSFLPLAPATVHILLALAAEDLHGYGIMQEVARQSGARYKLGPGTLYDNLQRLLKQGMVEEAGGQEGSRRRYYRLSSLGRGVLSAEIGRLDGVVREARLHFKQPRASVVSRVKDGATRGSRADGGVRPALLRPRFAKN